MDMQDNENIMSKEIETKIGLTIKNQYLKNI
jgi:hypothetical protein